MLQPFRRADATANTSSRLQSRGAACKGLFPWKLRSALARNEVGFLVACRAADGEEKRGEANLNVTKMSGFSHIPLDPFPPFRRYFCIRTERRCETASILHSLSVMVGFSSRLLAANANPNNTSRWLVLVLGCSVSLIAVATDPVGGERLRSAC